MSTDTNDVAQQDSVPALETKTIAEVLAARITQFSTSPKMLEIIDKKIESCLTNVIDDVFGRYSDFSEGTKKAFKASLPGSIDSVIDLGRYNAMIETRLRETFASSGIANNMIAKAEAALKEAMDETLFPPVIKLSTLIEAFIDDHKEQAREEGWECPDLRLIESDSVLTTEFRHFYFDKSQESSGRYSSQRSQYSLANCLDMRAIEGEEIDGDQVFEVYSAKIDDEFVQRIVNTARLRSKWEKMVFALYYGLSKVCVDCDPEDYSYPGYDD